MNLVGVIKNHSLFLEGNVKANLRRADLSEANLSGANLRRADLRRADLSGVNLSEANLRRADLRRADLSEANLSGANLSEANLSEANLSGANLSEANLSGANLSGVNLSEADLSGADLSEADLRRANLSGAKGVIIFNKSNGRTCYAVNYEKYFMIKAGCFWGSLDEFEKKANDTYPDSTVESYESQIKYLKSLL